MKISLITSTFNSAKTLQATFDSVRAQTYADLEYIVIDGASRDATPDIIRQNSDIITTYVSERDRGIYDALNKGVLLATGEVTGFIHSDDMLAGRDTIATIVRTFQSGDPDAVYGDLDYVDRTDPARIIRKWRSQPFDHRLFYRGWMPAHPTFYLKTKHYHTLGLYDLDFRISADYELMLRMLLKHRLRAAYVPEVLVKMRTGGESNVSLKNRLQANREDVKAWKKNGLEPRFYTRWLKPISKLVQYL